MEKVNISWAPLNIHESKPIVTKKKFANLAKHIYISFFTKFGNISWFFYFLNGKAIDFSQLKGKGFIFKKICYTSSFLKGSFTPKKLDITLLYTLGFFFTSCLSNLFLIGLLIFSSNFFTIMSWFAFSFFLKQLFHNFYSMLSNLFFNAWIMCIHKNILTKDASHDLKIASFNIFPTIIK
jgi:hypothetical protein